MKIFFLLLLFLYGSLSSAEEMSFWQDVGDNFAIPFSKPVRNTTFLLLTTTGFFFLADDAVNEHFEKDMKEEKPFGSWSKFGDLAGQLLPNALYLGGMYFDYWRTNSKLSEERARLMFQATFYSGVTTTVLKYTIREKRPNKNGGNESFPSGHSTTAFAFASVVGAEHEWYWGVAAYSLATFCGLSRVNDHRHYIHDVVAGATIGISYGLGLYYKMHGEKAAAEGEGKAVSWMQLLPTDNLDGALLTYSLSWR